MFSPETYLDQRNIPLIRPMIFATESEVKSAVYHAGLPIIKSRCPADGATVREQTKLFVQQMSRDDPAFRQKTLHALQQSGIDGWRPLHTGHTRGWAMPRIFWCRYEGRDAAAARPAQILLMPQRWRRRRWRMQRTEARCGYRNPTLSSILATQMPCRSRRSGA